MPVQQAEVRFVIDGNVNWLQLDAALIKNESGENLLAGMAVDISAMKSYISVLQKHNTKKNAILHILSHDLAGPIGVINNISTVLKREAGKFNDPKIDQYISVIIKTSKSSIKLIHDFVNEEFLESVGVDLLKRRTELVSHLRETVEEYRITQKELGLEFNFKTSMDKLYVDLDVDKFSQVLHNLISNSMKFTPEGGRIQVTLEEGEQTVILVVQDDGIGIPPKFHSTLFDKFTNARRTGLHGEESTGLGMSVIKTIIEWHGGTISFKSAENQGTTFYVSLPKSNPN